MSLCKDCKYEDTGCYGIQLLEEDDFSENDQELDFQFKSEPYFGCIRFEQRAKE
jgi:hypothetical protein